MAKLETILQGEFHCIADRIEDGLLDGSVSAVMEDWSDFEEGDSRCAVRVFEKYSHMSSDRVSLSVTLFQSGTGPVCLSAITSGGDEATLVQMNPMGEEFLLDKLRALL